MLGIKSGNILLAPWETEAQCNTAVADRVAWIRVFCNRIYNPTPCLACEHRSWCLLSFSPVCFIFNHNKKLLDCPRVCITAMENIQPGFLSDNKTPSTQELIMEIIFSWFLMRISFHDLIHKKILKYCVFCKLSSKWKEKLLCPNKLLRQNVLTINENNVWTIYYLTRISWNLTPNSFLVLNHKIQSHWFASWG